ncbi:MAG: branched-chain amino acid ABC transporter permease [Stackebrandtia sp.]
MNAGTLNMTRPTSRPATGRLAAWRPFLLTAVAAAALACVPLGVDNYTLSLLARAVALGLLAVSTALLTGVAGLPSLGQVAPYGVGAYVTAVLAGAEITVGPVQLAASAGAAAVFSAVTGIVIVRTRNVIFLSVTLAVGVLAAEVAGQWRSLTGGTDGTGRVEPTTPFWGAEPLIDDAHVYWYALATAAVVVAITTAALLSTPGRLLRGCRDSEARMRASGHRVTGYLLLANIAAGAIAGVGGSLLVTSQRFVSPSDVDFGTAALILLAVVVGGAHSMTGALAGVAVVIAVRDWLAPPGYRELMLGVVFVLCVYLMPKGLAGASTWLHSSLRGLGPWNGRREKPVGRGDADVVDRRSAGGEGNP